MSDPVQSVEIDDVLESVRRLVAARKRTAPGEATNAPSAPPPANDGEDSEKLVLGPALRVVVQRNSPKKAAEHSQPVNQVPQSAPDVESAPKSAPDRFTYPVPEDEPRPVAEPRIADPQPEPPAEPKPEQMEQPRSAPSLTGLEKLEVTLAALERGLNQANRFRPEKSEFEEPEGFQAETGAAPQLNDTQEAALEAEMKAEPQAAETVAEDAEPDQDAPQPVEVHGENSFFESEVVIEAEPARDQSGAYEVTDDANVQASIDEMVDDTLGTGSLIEDAQREIVRDVLRDELKGEMGERITRNIRKLVRREIYKALSARDFE